jgi:uncharacterized protein (DUF885 family)
MKMIWRVGAALVGLGTIGTAAIAAPPSKQSTRTSADARLKALYDGYSAWEDKEYGFFQNSRGEQEPAGYLAHVDETSQIRREAHLKDLLKQLDGLQATKLSPAERVNASIFRTVLENEISELHFRTWEMPFNSDSSFWTYLDASQAFDDAAGYRRYIARMRDIPRFFD